MQKKGNEDWHYSAPHGAGSDMGLKEASIGLVNNEYVRECFSEAGDITKQLIF